METYEYRSKHDNDILSFIMINKEDKAIQLLLAGVTPQMKSKGIFVSMLVDYFNMNYENGRKIFFGYVSGLNKESFNVYMFLDFKIMSSTLVMRKIYNSNF
jgi:hypothetical protein